MSTRGRPPYPDILTPRQHEVWQLLRQGLTNEEIAARLGISLDGAKYHVSEVLRRLGVESRHDAADWRPDAVTATRPTRWAWAAAPLVFVKKLHFSALAYAAASVATVAVAAGVALLVWGVVHTDHSPPSNAALEATKTPIPRTNIPELDHVIDLLVHQDIDGLVALVSFHPVPCGPGHSIGGQPTCSSGTSEGSPVDGFPVGACEGGDITSTDDLRAAFGAVLSRQPSAAVYAVIDDAPDDPFKSYHIVVTEDRPSQATATASFWTVSANGRLLALQTECGPVGAAQQTAYRFPGNQHFVLGPYNNCLDTPGSTANLMVTVESLSPGGIKPQFWGPAKTTLETDTGGRAIVNVTGDTIWNAGAVASRLEDVRSGMELQAVGTMGDDCIITAQTILAPLPDGVGQGVATAAGCPLVDSQFCGFAVQLQDALNGGNLGFISQRLVETSHPCNGAFHELGEDIGCPDDNGVSAPLVTLLHFQGDCCYTRQENFEASLGRWVASAPQDGQWNLYGVLPSAHLWGNQPEILLARGAGAGAPTIGVGFASQDTTISSPGVRVGSLSALFVSPDEQLLRWRDGPWIAPIGDTSALTHYRNEPFHVQLDFPAPWVPDPNYGGSFGGVSTAYVDQRGRGDGFLQIDALSSPSIDYAVQAVAYHKLKPYGDAPEISDISLPGGQAKLILPDPNGGPSSTGVATIIISYPPSVDTTGLLGGPYPFFELHARPQDIAQIAHTLQFIVSGAPTP